MEGGSAPSRTWSSWLVFGFWVGGPPLASHPHFALSFPRCSRLRTPQPPTHRRRCRTYSPADRRTRGPVTLGKISEPVFLCQSPAQAGGHRRGPSPSSWAPELLRTSLWPSLENIPPCLGRKRSLQGNLVSPLCFKNCLRDWWLHLTQWRGFWILLHKSHSLWE